MARSRRWLVLPIALALALWLVWPRERANGGAGTPAGVALDPGTRSSGPELVGVSEREARSSGSTPVRLPAPDSEAEEPAGQMVNFRLRVVEEGSRQPIAGARVLSRERGNEGERETGADGTCALVCPEEQLWLHFHVWKEGFVHLATQLEREPVLEVALSRGATLGGRVLADDTGAPVAGARLQVDHARCRCVATVVESDASGRYELPCVPRRESWTRIVIQAEGFPLHERTFELRSDEARIEQDFRLERGLEITGRVMDFTSGAGVSGAIVADFPADDAGRFRSWVAVDRASTEVHVHVSASGYCRLDVRYGGQELERSGALLLRLPKSIAVEGVVRDPAGNPLAGASIAAEIDEDRETSAPPEDDPARKELPAGWRLAMDSPFVSATSDPSGKFRLAGLLPWNRSTWVSGGKEGYEFAEQRHANPAAPGSTTWLELVLPPEPSASIARLEGRVSLDGLSGWWEGSLSWKGPTREGAVELSNGRFYAETEPGEVRFRLALDAVAGPIEGDSFVLELVPGSDVDHDVELRMPPSPITGRARFRDGAPVAGARITASCVPPGSPGYASVRASAESDAGGSFHLDVPALGSAYEIEAALGHECVTVPSVAAGTSGLELTFSLPGKVLFRVRDAVTGVALEVWDTSFRWRASGESEFRSWNVELFVQPDLEGWFSDELPAGWLDLEVGRKTGDHLTLLLERVWIPAGPEPARVEFLLDPGLSVRLQLAEGQEPWPEDHGLFLVEEKLWDDIPEGAPWERFVDSGLNVSARMMRFEEGGTATTRGLAPGRFCLRVFPDDLSIEPREIVLAEKDQEPVLVRWSPR